MKRLKFGIEIEFIGITREAAATIVADFFGTGFFYEGGELKERDITRLGSMGIKDLKGAKDTLLKLEKEYKNVKEKIIINILFPMC